MTYIGFLTHLFLGIIEPGLIHFGTRRNIMFSTPYGTVHTIMSGWNVHDFLFHFHSKPKRYSSTENVSLVSACQLPKHLNFYSRTVIN